jgi:hypothetical protein
MDVRSPARDELLIDNSVGFVDKNFSDKDKEEMVKEIIPDIVSPLYNGSTLFLPVVV